LKLQTPQFKDKKNMPEEELKEEAGLIKVEPLAKFNINTL